MINCHSGLRRNPVIDPIALIRSLMLLHFLAIELCAAKPQTAHFSLTPMKNVSSHLHLRQPARKAHNLALSRRHVPKDRKPQQLVDLLSILKNLVVAGIIQAGLSISRQLTQC